MLNKIDFSSLVQCVKLIGSLFFTGFAFYLANIFNSVKFLATTIAALASIYFVLQRFHLRLQVRFLKNISDEIIKINDFCIEFSYKHEQLLDSLVAIANEDEQTDPDPKIITELKTLRSKIKNHLDYLTSQINAFPYGNPLNFFWFSIMGKYLMNQVPLEADALLTTYQDVILTDTILQSEISLFENYREQALIDSDKIDDIVIAGIDLITLLEDHSKKFI